MGLSLRKIFGEHPLDLDTFTSDAFMSDAAGVALEWI